MRPKANLRGRFSPSTTALRSGHRPEDPIERYDPSAPGERPLSNTALAPHLSHGDVCGIANE